MLLMEVEMITGFIADTDYLATQPDVKLHDVRGRFVAIYFEGVGLIRNINRMYTCTKIQ